MSHALNASHVLHAALHPLRRSTRVASAAAGVTRGVWVDEWVGLAQVGLARSGQQVDGDSRQAGRDVLQAPTSTTAHA